tara:strand:- start:9989 stop:10318 length:330 start_codon:yes stop_codon:yes gene_type:complete
MEAAEWSEQDVRDRTELARRDARMAEQVALGLATDFEKKRRLASQLCKICHYTMQALMGGSLFTVEVAKEREICRHCGADIELRLPRPPHLRGRTLPCSTIEPSSPPSP